MNDDSPDAESPESRWPRDGDRLFVERAWRYDAHVVRDPSERFYRLPMGFKRVGDILVAQAATNLADRPNVIYAALFCYRQAIELFLKRLIDEFSSDKAQSTKHTHKLNVLWERFMLIAKERGSAESTGVSAARALIAEMHEADQKSDGFRYPAGRDDAPFRFGDRGIDLDNLHNVMQGLENLFEAAYEAFSHQDEPRSEQRSSIFP